MHPDKQKWIEIQKDGSKRHVSTDPKDHEHKPLPLEDVSGPVVDGQVVRNPDEEKYTHEVKPLTKQEKREKAADAET